MTTQAAQPTKGHSGNLISSLWLCQAVSAGNLNNCHE